MGLYEHFKHSEVIIFGLDLETVHRLINDVSKRIREGQRFVDGERRDDLLQGYPCEFRSVSPLQYEGFLNYALWYYSGAQFPTLQLVWPDPQGRFPWECGFDEGYRADQTILD